MRQNEIRQALAQDIKREVLMDIYRSRTAPRRRQQFVECIKQDIMAELGHPYPWSARDYDQSYAEVVKAEVLAQIRSELPLNTAPVQELDRSSMEALKAEIRADLEAEQESKPESYSHLSSSISDPALVQAVKESVLAELKVPRQK